MESFGKANSTIDALWLKEAQDRMAAYRAGELGAVDAEEVFSQLGHLHRHPEYWRSRTEQI